MSDREAFEPFGVEWENEMMKMNKRKLIAFIKSNRATLQAENDKLQLALDQTAADLESTKFDNKQLRCVDNEERWMWQPEGDNYLESLGCPIVIMPADLRALIERVREQFAIACLNLWEETNPPTVNDCADTIRSMEVKP